MIEALKKAREVIADTVTCSGCSPERGASDGEFCCRQKSVDAIAAIDAALSAQKISAMEVYKQCEHLPEEPLERLRYFCSLSMPPQDWLDVEQLFDDVIAQQSAEQARKPLTEEQITDLVETLVMSRCFAFDLVRLVERAHGIGD